MMRGGKTFVCVFGSFLLSTSAHALVADSLGNPYNRIVERNLFNLKQPAPPPSNVPPPTPPPTITLTSITTILGKKLVTMTIPAKPGQPIQNLMLAEGQGQEGIEVLQIDETAGVVRVKNQGIEQTLDFLNNGAKPVSGPAPTFQVPAPIPAQPLPSGGAPQFNPGSGRPQLPSRNLRMPGAANQSSMRSATPMNVNGNAPGQSQPSLSPEEQAVLIEAQRLRYRQQGNPIANILPPTEMTPELAPQ